MTGERMETVREALGLLRSIIASGEPLTMRAIQSWDGALAEVERWERDRARADRIEALARRAYNFIDALGKHSSLALDLEAALGEGQDSDRPAVGECPCDGGRGCVCQ